MEEDLARVYIDAGGVDEVPHELREVLPRCKSDFERVERVVQLGYPVIAPIIPHLLVWMQDGNWPISHRIGELLASVGEPLTGSIRDVLRGRDGVWKYWILDRIVKLDPGTFVGLVEALEQLVNAPTDDDLEQGVSALAAETLDALGRPAAVRDADRLLAALERQLYGGQGAPPSAWLSAHAPGRTLRDLWDVAANAVTLVMLGAIMADLRDVVATACACADAVSRWIPAEENRARFAIEAAQAWVRGLVPVAEVSRASDAANDARCDVAGTGDTLDERRAAWRANCAIAAARGASLAVASETSYSAVHAAAWAIDYARRADRAVDLAAIVRAHLPCPTLTQLDAAFAREASASPPKRGN